MAEDVAAAKGRRVRGEDKLRRHVVARLRSTGYKAAVVVVMLVVMVGAV
jgi:hypothetical protein